MLLCCLHPPFEEGPSQVLSEQLMFNAVVQTREQYTQALLIMLVTVISADCDSEPFHTPQNSLVITNIGSMFWWVF